MRALALTFAVLLATAPAAQPDPGAQARAALAALEEAALQLDRAEGARDRVRALTATIQAFEEGLGAMREGLRQAAIRERALAGRLAAKDSEIASLLGALQTMGRVDAPTIFLHPQGAMGTARASLLLAEIGPALNTGAEDLRRDLQEVQTLRLLQQDAADRMAAGLSQLQQARAELNQAMAERRDLPRRFVTDPVATALLIDSAETLDGFASGLSQIVEGDSEPAQDFVAGLAPGEIPLPVQGVILRRPGEADAAGVTRPGVLLATRPGALVTSPTAGTIRYAGPLLDFGQVVMLEPAPDALIILAGLARTYGSAGEVVPAGTPLGLMGGAAATNAELITKSGDGAGNDRTETLYIEVRQDNGPVDPSDWFDLRSNN